MNNEKGDIKTLNNLLYETEDRRRYFMRESTIPYQPSTKPRDEEKRKAVIALEIAIIKSKVDMSKFSKPSEDIIRGWTELLGRN
jgi:hypothetical protein